MMNEFEMSIKRAYAGDDQEFKIELQDVKDDVSVGIEDEMITVKPLVNRFILMRIIDNSNSSVLKTIFDHVIGQILRLVEKQVDQVGDAGNTVKVSETRIFLPRIIE
jgi:hypothetical protein